MRARTAVGWAGALSVGVASCVAVAFAAWHVDMPGEGGVAPGDWETASIGDCALMAQSMQALKMGAQEGPPLMGQSRARGPCDWTRWNLHPGQVTHAEFAAATRGAAHNTGYIPHIGLSRPRYSLFRLRALVAASHAYGWLGGNGYLCHLRRGFDGWRLERCEATWIA
jgi:hypothetical protein